MPRAGRTTGRPKASSTARGYGTDHQKERARWSPIVAAGQACCARCRWVIVPGQPWDLDHRSDRTGYLGPSHRRCNRSPGGRNGAKVANAKRAQWRNPQPRKGRHCEVCATTYDATYQQQRTCSRACGLELQRRNRGPAQPDPPPRQPVQRLCSECGLTFETSHSSKITCSQACAVGRNRRTNRQLYQRRVGLPLW